MTREDPYRDFCRRCEALRQKRAIEETTILPGGRASRDGTELLNFSGNDYLGLSRHPELIEKMAEYAQRYGAGATASRLVSGNHPAYGEVEERLARGKGYETALIFNSGYQANVAVIAALADAEAVGKQTVILADRLCHNSLLQGALLSGARLSRYRHNDIDHLQSLLRAQAGRGTHVLVVSESVFGMDGDRADLEALGGISHKYGALLYIDEAHATGLYGPDGFGFAAAHKGAADIAMGTFGKALGSCGAYVACSAVVRDYLIQRCGGLIYSTGLPPPVLGAIGAALELLPRMEKERAYLHEQSARLKKALEGQGWNCGASTTHIIPVILGGEQAATELSGSLRARGILAPAIRPPTVPRGASRLRISLSAAHAAADIDRLIAALGEEAARFARPQSLAS